MGTQPQQPEERRNANGIAVAVIVAISAWLAAPLAPAHAIGARLSVYEATLEDQGQRTPELATDELMAILARKSALVFDARPPEDYALAHIPGSLSLDEKQLGRFTQSIPDRATLIVVYSNGPFCDRARLRAQEFVQLGYTRVSRYQLGLPVWRALGNTAETTLAGFRQVFRDSNAILIDTRGRAQYAAGTVPGALSILAGEVSKAKQDRRLRYYDQSTRMVVFANSAGEARAVAEEFARNAYSNASFLGATYDELKRAKFFTERKPVASNLDDLTQ